VRTYCNALETKKRRYLTNPQLHGQLSYRLS